jgi:hypothetical protein
MTNITFIYKENSRNQTESEKVLKESYSDLVGIPWKKVA